MLADNINRNNDGLTDQWGTATSNQSSEPWVCDVVAQEDIPDILISQDIECPRNDGEDVDPESFVKAFDPLVLDDLAESIEGSLVYFVPPLNLQPCFDQSKWVEDCPDSEGAGNA